uniref:Protein FAM192A n=1 Tax=Cacopsylla melanoneura TaxID=428564 RepID=A0A8D8YX64_9HEMI
MSSGFISENEIANQRKIRQEEWEKVRTADQPEEAPEEQYDPRSLYDRLKEQKDKKEFEYEEAHKLKNMIKGLDDEEVEFLDLVDKSKYEEEKRKYLEESKELNEFRMKRACLEEEHLAQRIKNEIKSSTKSNPSSNKIF